MADPLDRLRALVPVAGARPAGLRPAGARPGGARPAGDGEAAPAPGRTVPVLVSLAVATVLWFTFSLREPYTVAIDAPLRVTGVPEGRALAAPPPARVSVQLRGPGRALLGLDRTPPTLEVEAGAEPVDLRREATASNRFPPGVVVQGVTPATLALDLDERVVRRLPVRLAARYQTPAPYALLLPPILWPDSVTVSGARRVLDGLEAWPTRRVDLGVLRQTHVQRVALSDTLAGLVERSAEAAEVTLQVEEFTEGQRWLEVRAVNVPPGVAAVRFRPARVRATYLVPTSGDFYDRALASERFYAVVDYADVARDSAGLGVPAVARVPDDLPVRHVRIRPRRLGHVTVRE